MHTNSNVTASNEAPQVQEQHAQGDAAITSPTPIGSGNATAPAPTQAEYWGHLPEEMRWCHQWLLAGPNDLGQMKVPYTLRNGKAVPGSSTDSKQWLDFETACDAALSCGYGIGFVLSADDPYTCIDLDVKNAINAPNEPDDWTSQGGLDYFWKLVQECQSYTERSRSGQGLHIWVRAAIGKGCNYAGIEVYSQDRFMACTGDVVIATDIVPAQERVDVLVAQIRLGQGASRGGKLALVEVEEELDDEEIIARACSAGNADKFNALCNCTSTSDETGELGSFVDMGFKSQSEADLALLSMFTFYSKSNEQCRRLFRMSGLGKRSKATKSDRYLDDTLKVIRTRQVNEAVMDDHSRALAASLVQEMRIAMVEHTNTLPAPEQGKLEWPPGFTGDLAKFIYNAAPRPVQEVAIVGALGLLAGICGRRWVLPSSGLNVYIILVARSAIGKEAMHSGIATLIKATAQRAPDVMRFVNFSDFASGPALIKSCAANRCFVNVAGEFGHKFARMAQAREGADHSLRHALTKLYSKSGPQSIAGGINYSNTDNNADINSDVAYSLVGETTPGTFYEAITQDMMSDGFMSRFVIVSYEGDRPEKNQAPQLVPPDSYIIKLADIVTQASSLDLKNIYQDVVTDTKAKTFLESFEDECDNNIKAAGDNESLRQMWNRAHLKVLRIAALTAVADNHLNPCIAEHHAKWAIQLIRSDIAVFAKRLQTGDIGDGDDVRQGKVSSLLTDYLANELSPSWKKKLHQMKQNGIVPFNWLQNRTQRLASFEKHRFGATKSLQQTLASLIDCGDLSEVPKTEMVAKFGTQAKAYRIAKL